jgi:hypothetical protein
MPACPDDGLLDITDVRHEVQKRLTVITVIQLQTELLQRQLRHREAIVAADRRWLEDRLATTLATTLAAVKALSAWVDGIASDERTGP